MVEVETGGPFSVVLSHRNEGSPERANHHSDHSADISPKADESECFVHIRDCEFRPFSRMTDTVHSTYDFGDVQPFGTPFDVVWKELSSFQ